MATNLNEALAQLARAAPQEWARFLEAYREHYNHRVSELVAAQQNMVSVAQGRAQEAAEMLRKTAEATPGVKTNA